MHVLFTFYIEKSIEFPDLLIVVVAHRSNLLLSTQGKRKTPSTTLLCLQGYRYDTRESKHMYARGNC